MRKALIASLIPMAALAAATASANDAAQVTAEIVIDGKTFTEEEIERGGEIFLRRCSQCHGLDHTNYKGPWLNGILNRPSASIEDWAYSEPFRAWGGTWTVENLRTWLTKPQDFIPGTEMNFGGFRRRAEDRDMVIAYLMSRSLAEAAQQAPESAD